MVSVNAARERRWQGAKKVSGATGIPGAVQAKFEAASGMSFEDVRVHYNSPRPAQLGAYAYTQGSQVYIGPGQERHLEHELGHVVQQKQGIVKADGYVNGVPVNRDGRLERAADLGAAQPVQGLWKNPGSVAQMAPPGEEEEEEERAETKEEEKAKEEEERAETKEEEKAEKEEEKTDTKEEEKIEESEEERAEPTGVDLDEALLQELAGSGKRYTPEDIVAITKTASGMLVWLEKGTEKAGLKHIIGKHADDFKRRGIGGGEIPNYIMTALRTGEIVGYQGRGTGRPIYEFEYNGVMQSVAITVGENGFIVGANPA